MSSIEFLDTELKSYWEIVGIRDASLFFRKLPMLLPEDAILCFEGSHVSHDVALYLKDHSIPPRYELPKGTIWPRSSVSHIPLTDATANGLAALAEDHAWPEISEHIQAYAEGKTLFTWFDAFDDPLCLAIDIAESTVCEFCNELSAAYKHVAGGND